MTREEAERLLDGGIERLAALEHERWAHWQRYMHGKGELREDGALVLPAELVAKWQKQIETEYASLSHEEKESDREQVRRYLPAIVELLAGRQSQT